MAEAGTPARPRTRREPTDSWRVRLALARHFARKMGPPLAAVALYTFVAGFVVRWDMGRSGEATHDLGRDMYAMYTQLFFEPTEDLPSAPIARALYWFTPLVGAVLIAEGLLKIGAQLFDAEARRALATRIMIDKTKGHVVVCGLGHVGFRVIESLLASHTPIVAIEKRASDSFREHVEALGIPVITGDARRDELLVEAGIERAIAVVCATNDDLANLEVAIDAKRMNPTIRVVMRMFDQRLASKVEGALDLDRTFSTSALAGPLVALWATQDGVRSVYQLGARRQLRATAEVEVGVDARLCTVRELEEAFDARVVSLKKRGLDDFDRVRAETRLGARDVVLVDVAQAELAKLRAALGVVG